MVCLTHQLRMYYYAKNIEVHMITGADPGLTVGGGLSIPRALACAKFYVLRPLLTSFPHTTSYTKKK